jgi:acyl CoA:acetate/3-ketoacid CoA transferase beta subunit
VNLIITELAVFKVSKSGGPLLLIEKAPEVTVDYIRQRTAADMIVSDNLIDMLQ